MSTANDISMTDIEKGLTEDKDNIPEEKSLLEKDNGEPVNENDDIEKGLSIKLIED